MKIDWKELQKIDFGYLFYQRRYFLVAVLSLGVTGLMLLLLIFVQVPELFAANNQRQEEKRTLLQLQQKIIGLQDLETFQSSDIRQKIDLALPSEKPLLGLLAGVSTAAQGTQVTLAKVETNPGKISTASASLQNVQSADISGVSPISPAVISNPNLLNVKITGVDTLQIQLTIVGTLPQINAFVDRVERFAPITDITQIKLDTIAGPGIPLGTYTAKLLLTSFYFTQSLRIGVDNPLPEVKAKEQAFLDNLNSFTFPQQTQSQNGIQSGGSTDLFGVPPVKAER